MMRKIDILNFITNNRKAPNDIKTFSSLLNHLGATNEPAIKQMLGELVQARVVKEIEANGEKSYQVIARWSQFKADLKNSGLNQTLVQLFTLQERQRVYNPLDVKEAVRFRALQSVLWTGAGSMNHSKSAIHQFCLLAEDWHVKGDFDPKQLTSWSGTICV
jgi:hypothetical protein